MNRQVLDIEILTFAGCPNTDAARELVLRVIDEIAAEAAVREVLVEDADDALRLRFLGSPTIRVDGRNVEPGAAERTSYVYACRMSRATHPPTTSLYR